MSHVRIKTNGTACAPLIEIDGVNVAGAVSTVEITMEPGEVPCIRLTVPTGLDLELDAEVAKLIDALPAPNRRRHDRRAAVHPAAMEVKD